MSLERHYFPGNNTPLGFFSYYKHILGQREANKIICMKGGPGTGKSTFMKRIGEAFADLDEDIDYLHCSADENSLDGVVLRKRRIAVIDGTSPHTTDPVTPGAVDKIINLGEFWNEDGILLNKEEIIDRNEECSRWYRIAYNYLSAAKSVFRSLEEVYNRAVSHSEVYRVVADIVGREYQGREICLAPGREKRFFASAITASGTVNYLPSLLADMERIYLISVPVGYVNSGFMSVLREGAIYRGIDIESFYCPLCPDEKIDHLVIPQLKTAFVTVNEYHDIEPWEILEDDGKNREIILLDVSDYMNSLILAQSAEFVASLLEEFDILLDKAAAALEKAKNAHMQVESLYVPNMNFTEINQLMQRTIEELAQQEVR